MTTSSEPHADAATAYEHCTAQHCANQAVGLCPCRMALCAACLARHARYLGAEYQQREQDDEQER